MSFTRRIQWKYGNFTFFSGAGLLDGVDCSTFVSLDAITCGTITAITITKVENSIFLSKNVWL